MQTESPPDCASDSLDAAILRTLVYADLFDYPLTASQLHRYLVGRAAPLQEIEEHLGRSGWLHERAGCKPPFCFLAGRAHLTELRRQREEYAGTLWPLARRYGQRVAALPFVRMVAVSGSLAMNNVASPHDDVDLLIVAQPGRVWFARGLALLIVYLARRRGVELCPNYVVAAGRFAIAEPSLFAAHELAQMVPLYGRRYYDRLLEQNGWIGDLLPNAVADGDGRDLGRARRGVQAALETPFAGRLGDVIEHWERRRKIPRLTRESAQCGATETEFGAEICKGHLAAHAGLVLQRYAAQLAALGL